MNLKLFFAGVLRSSRNVSQSTSIWFYFLNGSGHINTGFKYISLLFVVAYSVDDPSYVHHSRSCNVFIGVKYVLVLLLQWSPVPSIQIYSARVTWLMFISDCVIGNFDIELNLHIFTYKLNVASFKGNVILMLKSMKFDINFFKKKNISKYHNLKLWISI